MSSSSSDDSMVTGIKSSHQLLLESRERIRNRQLEQERAQRLALDPIRIPTGNKQCKCGKPISLNKVRCSHCVRARQATLRSGFCPGCAAKILDYSLHPRTGPEYFNWLHGMVKEEKNPDTGHKYDCPMSHVRLNSDQPLPELEEVQ